jgi:protein-L-isoaspartate(D-aspartate) O-methyltransferase
LHVLTHPEAFVCGRGALVAAYTDHALPIEKRARYPSCTWSAHDRIAWPYDQKVLEIGTGSGYQAAILSMVAHKVYSIERIGMIAARARKLLDGFMCPNVIIRVSDGTLGWPDEAPFDAIIVTAGSPTVPDALIAQLRSGGRLVIPVGQEEDQRLLRITKREDGGADTEVLGGCKFVKLIGKQGWQQEARERAS